MIYFKTNDISFTSLYCAVTLGGQIWWLCTYMFIYTIITWRSTVLYIYIWPESKGNNAVQFLAPFMMFLSIYCFYSNLSKGWMWILLNYRQYMPTHYNMTKDNVLDCWKNKRMCLCIWQNKIFINMYHILHAFFVLCKRIYNTTCKRKNYFFVSLSILRTKLHIEAYMFAKTSWLRLCFFHTSYSFVKAIKMWNKNCYFVIW